MQTHVCLIYAIVMYQVTNSLDRGSTRVLCICRRYKSQLLSLCTATFQVQIKRSEKKERDKIMLNACLAVYRNIHILSRQCGQTILRLSSIRKSAQSIFLGVFNSQFKTQATDHLTVDSPHYLIQRTT